jgi:hypothetical protein
MSDLVTSQTKAAKGMVTKSAGCTSCKSCFYQMTTESLECVPSVVFIGIVPTLLCN